jgi:histidine ammonia-lyase
LAAAQAVDLRGVKKLGAGTRSLYNTLRKAVVKLTRDRIIADDVIRAEKVLQLLTLQNIGE